MLYTDHTISIYSSHITARLMYVLDFCFKSKGVDYNLVQQHENIATISINYSHTELDARVSIPPQGILFETEIYPSKEITYEEGKLLIDGVYDPLGLIFFLLTRYESYFSEDLDQHGRLKAENNVLVKFKLNERPVVDEIVKALWAEIGLNYQPVKDGFKMVPSFDIDVAWAYKQRSFIRTVGGMIKGGKPIDRMKVMMGSRKDPYDTYADISLLSEKVDHVVCFTLLGDWGKYDKNIHWENAALGALIRGLHLYSEVGIHPSYQAHLNEAQLGKEVNRLTQITGQEVSQSRQHFLRLKIPNTYLQLEKAGITDEYSMGFADHLGFRAGTSFSFPFFDLMKNRVSNVQVHPFMYMDSALKDYLKLSPEVAKEKINKLVGSVKAVGGTFMFIWHNSSIHDKDEWKGWKAVLDYTVELNNL